MPAATLRRISMKALARYQVILLGEQRHIRCEQLAQGCFPNSAAVGVEPATSRSRGQRSNHYTTEPPIRVVVSPFSHGCMVVQISREGWGVRRALGNRQSVQIVYRQRQRTVLQ